MTDKGLLSKIHKHATQHQNKQTTELKKKDGQT